ncbi:alveolar macrophage chemotactic factor 2-like [Emydura macquarii macquarii]|uniref:alveolar macrophage chemotactic factor 2-like n=1 Tax=Emydura macquarii macquarii TaxID=1129001 RepID=UPI00352AB6AB
MSSVHSAACVALFLLYLCSEHQADQLAQAVHVPTRCMCKNFQKGVHPNFITDFQVVEKGAHCYRYEIILTVRLPGGQRTTCLDLSKKQGKKLLSCWKRHLKDPKKQQSCTKSRQRPRTRPNQ